jgi:hypothetical protein
MKYLVYGLIDPITMMVRYVGKSSNGLARPKSHKTPTNRIKKTYVGAWIRSLYKQGLTYTIVVLEVCSERADLPDCERWWISYGRLSGWPLTNLTDGGEGRPGYIPTPETRQRMSDAQRGRPLTEQHKEALRVPKQYTPESRQRMKEDRKLRMTPSVASQRAGVLWSKPGAKETASERMTKMWEDPEYAEHMSVAHTGKQHTEEHKTKIRDALRGENNPAKRPENKLKISEGLRRSWEHRKNAKIKTG